MLDKEFFINLKPTTMSNEMMDTIKKLRTKIEELQADKEELLEGLEHILEYWNRDRNDKAMHDALWHIIETGENLIQKHKIN